MKANLIDRRVTVNTTPQGTDLYGFPAGEADRREQERLARVRDPNAQLGIEWEHLKKNATMFAAELAEREKPNILPESLFLQGFLSMFATLFTGDPKEMEAVADSGIIYSWVQVAGTPNRSVNVVYNDNQERVMFTVPPIFHKNRSVLNMDAQSSLLAVIDKAQRIHSVNPPKGNEFYYTTLQQYMPRASKEHAVADHIQLLRIFDHYDTPLWDAASDSYKTVKELGALDNLNAAAAPVEASVRPVGTVGSAASSAGSVEEL